MLSREEALSDLEAILDRIGSGIWLQVDDCAINHWFGGEEDPIEAAEKFARRRKCCFIYARNAVGKGEGEGVGKFGRAYSR